MMAQNPMGISTRDTGKFNCRQIRKVAGKGRTTATEPMASMEYSRLPNPADGAIFRSDPFASEQADDAP